MSTQLSQRPLIACRGRFSCRRCWGTQWRMLAGSRAGTETGSGTARQPLGRRRGDQRQRSWWALQRGKKPDETRGRTKWNLRHCCKSFAKTGGARRRQSFFFSYEWSLLKLFFFSSSGCCWKVILQCLLQKSPLSHREHCLRMNFNTAARSQGCHSDYLFVVSAHISLTKQTSHVQSAGT